MKKLLLSFLMLSAVLSSAAVNYWTAYMSYHNATKTIPANGLVYALCSGSIYTYRPGDTKVNTFSKATGLSDCNVQYMVYNKQLSSFLLIYSNYNIDILGTNDSVTNLTEYKNSSLRDKTINDVTITGNSAYIATNFGVVIVNMERCEFSNTYNIGRAVKSCACVDGKILALTDQGIYGGNLEDNLIDENNWQHLSSAVLAKCLPFNGKFYASSTDGLYRVDTSTGVVTPIHAGSYSYANSECRRLILGNASQIVTMDSLETFHSYTYANDFNWLSYDGNYFWASRSMKGTQPFSLHGDTLQAASNAIIPNSPVRNFCYYLTYTKNNRLLVAGGNLNYTLKDYAGTLMAYEDNKWTNFDEDSIEIKTGKIYQNLTAIIEDPNDTNHHYASAAGAGLYEYRSGRFVHLYDCDNSPLTSILPSSTHRTLYVRTAGLQYDKSGNLWMLNNQVDTIVRILMKDGTWRSIYLEGLDGYPTFDHILFDSRGWAWITHRRTTAVHHAGIVCLNYGGTIDNTSDDTQRFCYSFTNQDNTSYTFNQVYDVAEDRNGQIWIGTNQGPFLLTDPTTIFNTTPSFTQVKVPRNDGTNYVDYLLTGVPITSIAIDGGNRKWFGTDGNGIYLISDDGITTIHHFTAENSPLLSNVIYSIAINPEDGRVMIGTDAGLISYRSDATEPKAELTKSNIKIYPNPVRPTFDGNLRVDGLAYDSDVKITTVSGQVIAQGTSVGGTFTWNLLTKNGDRVSTGVYYVIASDQEGNKGALGKFLVVK